MLYGHKGWVWGLLCIALSSVAVAQVPGRLTHQGRLTDRQMVPVEGMHTLRFSIYDKPTGGDQLWTELQQISIKGGYYATTLGALQPIPQAVFGASPRFLGITIDSDSELAPRSAINSVPYALMCGGFAGEVSATSVKVAGKTVIDGNGNWVGTSSGTSGTAGPAGATGATGPAGAQGPQGIPGPIGMTGATGPVGPAGPAGASGATGAAGPAGPAGAAGPVCTNGCVGAAALGAQSVSGPKLGPDAIVGVLRFARKYKDATVMPVVDEIHEGQLVLVDAACKFGEIMTGGTCDTGGSFAEVEHNHPFLMNTRSLANGIHRCYFRIKTGLPAQYSVFNNVYCLRPGPFPTGAQLD